MSHQTRRSLPSVRIACCTLLVAALTYACDSSTEPQPGDRGIRVVSGGGQTDTIAAKLNQPLVVEIRDSTGRIVPGATVQFQDVYDVGVSASGQQQYGSFATDVADARGHASTFVQLGGAVGIARLAVSVPELGVSDTVTYTIPHGSPWQFTISPRDTSLLPGQSFTLTVKTADIVGNPIPEAVPSFSAATGVTVTSSGTVTASSALLRTRITVAYQKLSDSASVSVVPLFSMVVNKSGSAVLVNTDGTGRVTLMAPADASIAPSSVRTTSSVVYYQGDPGIDAKVMVVQPNGTPRPLLSGGTGADAWPRLSPDGTWVYFVRNLNTLWRAHLDGTGLESLASFTPVRVFSAPTVSPDGKSVAIEDGTSLRIVDVATKVSRTVPGPCGYPSWSPDGAFFACARSEDLSVIRTDGTGRRVVAPSPAEGPWQGGPTQLSGIDWSPDGKWLFAIVGPYANLYDLASGSKLPLSGIGFDFSQASFVR